MDSLRKWKESLYVFFSHTYCANFFFFLSRSHVSWVVCPMLWLILEGKNTMREEWQACLHQGQWWNLLCELHFQVQTVCGSASTILLRYNSFPGVERIFLITGDPTPQAILSSMQTTADQTKMFDLSKWWMPVPLVPHTAMRNCRHSLFAGFRLLLSDIHRWGLSIPCHHQDAKPACWCPFTEHRHQGHKDHALVDQSAFEEPPKGLFSNSIVHC